MISDMNFDLIQRFHHTTAFSLNPFGAISPSSHQAVSSPRGFLHQKIPVRLAPGMAIESPKISSHNSHTVRQVPPFEGLLF